MDWVSWSMMDQDLKVKSTWKVHSLNWSRIWLKLFPELQWNENMVINCDMWCCPEWTVGLEAVLEPNYVFVQFWKERGNCKTASTAHSTQQKNSKWGFSLKSFTGQTPSWPLLPQKLCPNWSNQLTPSDIRKRRYRRLNKKSPHAANSELRWHKRWRPGWKFTILTTTTTTKVRQKTYL